MPIIVKSGGKQFTPAPAGPQSAVCCDVVDLGEVTTKFKDERTGALKVQHQGRIVFQSEHSMQDGKPFMVQQQYNLTLGSTEKPSKLREHLETWRGKPFTEQEAEGFDIERLIGVNCYIMVQHVAMSKGGIWAAVKAIMPALKGIPALKVRDYQRVKDRPAEAGSSPAPHDNEPFPETGNFEEVPPGFITDDDQIPF